MNAPPSGELSRGAVLSSVVRALLGAVTPEIRRVGFVLEGRELQVVCVHDGAPSESLGRELSDVGAELLADLAPDISVKTQLVRIDAPDIIQLEAVWVYARKEVNSK